MKTSELDKNLIVNTDLNLNDIVWMDVCEPPFNMYGFYDNKKFTRMPSDVAKDVNESVYGLYTNTSGGRARFSTNSSYIAIKAAMPNICHLPHMSLLGTSGFTLYEDTNNTSAYYSSFMPYDDMKKGYESVVYTDSIKMHSYTINFPLYNNLTSLYIGVQKRCIIESGSKYANKTPIVFYGSSITQGACASHSGNSYVNMISRYLNTDIINLGFSGGCKGEESISKYMAKLNMSMFVLDYDFNAPTVEHLQNTHYSVYENIRSENKTLPILMISKVSMDRNKDDLSKRYDIIKKTYDIAVKNGDKNVYLLDGQKIFSGEFCDSATVDCTHPNDIGFYRMAIIIGNEIKRILKI